MQLATHHRFALVAALGLVGVAVFDAVTQGVTGHLSVFSDDSETAWLAALGNVVHGVAYAGALWVLRVERRRLRVTRTATVFWWLLVAAFTPLAVGFLTVGPLHAFGLAEQVVTLGAPVIGIAFVLQILAAAGLGLSLVQRPETGPGSRILLTVVPVIGVTVLVSLVASDWAHPAYAEASTILGVALLGAASPSSRAGRSRTWTSSAGVSA